jgi:hypothetical protein
MQCQRIKINIITDDDFKVIVHEQAVGVYRKGVRKTDVIIRDLSDDEYSYIDCIIDPEEYIK